MGLASDFVAIIREHKAWWLVPVIVVLVLVGIFVVFSQSSVLSPFIYAFF